MSHFQIRDENYSSRVRASFARQGFMQTLGAELTDIGPGHSEITVPYADGLTQQHGFFHGGLIGTIADNAAGYASFSLMAAEDSVLTVEYKMNIMAPAQGNRLIARGHIIRPGRRITVAQADVFARQADQEVLCATLLGTFMTLHNTPDDPSMKER